MFALVVCLTAAAAVADDAKPAPVAGRSLTPAAEAALARHLKDALNEGFVIGPKHLYDAEKHLGLARRAAPVDPRPDYVLGLVLVRQSQVKAAVEKFEAVVKTDEGSRYWPAWQGAIWGHLVDKQYEKGLAKLDEFAVLVQNAEKPDEVSEEQRTAARWIGQMIESLTRCAESQKVHDLLVDHQVHLLDTFGSELSEAVEAGRESIRDRDFELAQAAGVLRSVSARDKERRNQDRLTKIDKDIVGLGKAKNDAQKSAEEWKEWLDDALAKSDKQLGLFERDYKFLDQRALSLSQSITFLGQEITSLEFGLNTFNPRNTTPFVMQNAQFQLLQRQNQMFGYQMDYNQNLGRMQYVAQQGNAAMQQRAAAVKQYETATGQIVKKNADYDKWTARLKDERQKLAVQAPAAKGAKKAPADKKLQFTLKSFVPLNLEVEKERLLASFAHPQDDDDKGAKAAAK